MNNNHQFEKAQILTGHKRFAEAEKMLRKCLVDAPYFFAAQALLGFVLSEQEKHSEAIEDVRQAIALEPENGWAHYIHAVCLHSGNQGDPGSHSA